MLFYIIYIFIFRYLIFSLNVSGIYTLIINMFENTHNKVFFMGIIFGIILKIIYFSYKKIKIKINYKIILIIIVDIIKTMFISYHLSLVLISLVFVIFDEILKRKNIILHKYIKYIFYIFTPLSVIYLTKENNEKNILIVPSLIILIYKLNFSYLTSMSIKSSLGFIILSLLSFNIISNNKKRNIKMIFLIFLISLYYSSLF